MTRVASVESNCLSTGGEKLLEANLSLIDLLLCEVDVSGELSHCDAKRLQPGAEVAHHLRYQSLHRGNIDNLEFAGVNLACLRVSMEANLHIAICESGGNT